MAAAETGAAEMAAVTGVAAVEKGAAAGAAAVAVEKDAAAGAVAAGAAAVAAGLILATSTLAWMPIRTESLNPTKCRTILNAWQVAWVSKSINRSRSTSWLSKVTNECRKCVREAAGAAAAGAVEAAERADLAVDRADLVAGRADQVADRADQVADRVDQVVDRVDQGARVDRGARDPAKKGDVTATTKKKRTLRPFPDSGTTRSRINRKGSVGLPPAVRGTPQKKPVSLQPKVRTAITPVTSDSANTLRA